ncbi:MAG: FKBP-type peptidylprolyl isomerase [Flavobacteriaceae bacterium]
MNKFRFYFLLFFSVIIFSCNKSDSSSSVTIRDFKVQYASDIAMIEDFLNTHHLETTNSSGYDDQDVTFTKIPEGSSEESIMSWLNRDAYPKLLYKIVNLDDNDYKIYYVKLREDYSAGEAPTRVDGAKVAYKGVYLYYDEDNDNALTTKQFDANPYPDNMFVLNTVIRGWTEIIPLFKTGTKTVTEGQPTLYSQFGAGVMFVPSGLGYYNQAQVNLPSYSPLIFNFKLYAVTRMDQDADGVLSMYEDINGNGIFTDDDTDGDGIYDYLDPDDDQDGYFTKTEIKRPTSETGGYTIYYDFNGAAEDKVNTAYDERQGIPDCSGDFYTSTRLRKHLDKNCH